MYYVQMLDLGRSVRATCASPLCELFFFAHVFRPLVLSLEDEHEEADV